MSPAKQTPSIVYWLGNNLYLNITNQRPNNYYFIKRAKEKLDTEITTVTIPEVDISKVREIAANIGVKFRTREYIPCFW